MRILFWVAAAICLSLIPSSDWGEACCWVASRLWGRTARRFRRVSAPRPAVVSELDQRGGRGLAAPPARQVLLDDFGHHARAHRAATLTDGEAEARIHRDRLDQLDLHGDVVARHDHLHALGQVGHARDVGRPEVELRAVAREERRVTAALLLLQDVDLGLVLGVRGDGARLAEDLPALDLLALGAAQEAADVVAGLALVEDLAEHLDTGHHRLGGVLDADDLDLVAGVDDALL